MKNVKNFRLIIEDREIEDFIQNFESRPGILSYFHSTFVFGSKKFHNSGNLILSIALLLDEIEKNNEQFFCFEEGHKYGLDIQIKKNNKILVGVYEGSDEHIYECILDKNYFFREIFRPMELFIKKINSSKIKDTNFKNIISKIENKLKDMQEKLKNAIKK